MRRNTGSMIRTGTSSLTRISTAPNKDAAYLFGTKDQILSADVGKISHRSLPCLLRMAKRVFSLTLKAKGYRQILCSILSQLSYREQLGTYSLLGVERPESFQAPFQAIMLSPESLSIIDTIGDPTIWSLAHLKWGTGMGGVT